LEQDDPQAAEAMRLVHGHTGNAYRIGVTGPPGVGKSTLVSALIDLYRKQGLSVGVLAVDPSSPYSGGALLGDRIRMQRHYLDAGVFIRSVATRGAHGGLPPVIKSAARLLDASGKDVVMVETAGVGQTELAVMDVADTVVVVLDPESGDSVQTLKAGLLEIADVLVVNKADREGAERLVVALQATVAMAERRLEGWVVPVLASQATEGKGVPELAGAVQQHRQLLLSTGGLAERRMERRRKEFTEALEERMLARLRRQLAGDPQVQVLMAQVERGELDPYVAARDLMQRVDS
jgi:LAO/AO transport system kinase